jgi:alanine dehydrogenase
VDETLLIDADTVRSSINPSNLVREIENAYVNEYNGDASMPVREHISTGSESEILSMPARLSDGSVGVKWVSDFLGNDDLPPVMGTVIYNDKSTGEPLAIIDGTELTRIRTGCAAAIGTKHLTNRNPDSIGIIGLGSQSKDVLRYHGEIFDFEKVYASDIDDTAYENFVKEFGDTYNIERCSGGMCAEKSDVITTATPATSPVISSVDSKLHINALGADMPQKQEVSSDVLTSPDTTLVADSREQSKIGGEFSRIIEEDMVDINDIIPFGQVINDRDLSTQISSSMTVFDSTGLAVQDVVAARMVYQNVDKSQCETFKFS